MAHTVLVPYRTKRDMHKAKSKSGTEIAKIKSMKRKNKIHYCYGVKKDGHACRAFANIQHCKNHVPTIISNYFVLQSCPRCLQLTNHLHGVCQKCSVALEASTEPEATLNAPDCDTFTCPQCQNTWECMLDTHGPLQCRKCETVIECDIAGIGDLREDQLGKKLGKYSWCGTCEALTLNVAGTTYCSKSLAVAGYAGQGDRVFACEKCGEEKFWRWSYHCPRCDADSHAVICIDDNVHQDYDGNFNWEETWKCLVCGLVYDISNGT